ncbi:MAG: hypothetical protein KKA84_02310 [Bacteroidetes bacterium]|nr:hypothetical protein [Bacteroidota bacterium]
MNQFKQHNRHRNFRFAAIAISLLACQCFAQYNDFKDDLLNHFINYHTEFSVRYFDEAKTFVKDLDNTVNSVLQTAELRGVFLASMEYSVQYSSNRAKVDFKVSYLETAQNVFNTKKELAEFISQKLQKQTAIFSAGIRITSRGNDQSLATEMFYAGNKLAENVTRQILVSSFGCDITSFETYVNFEFSVGYFSANKEKIYAFNQSELDSIVSMHLAVRDMNFVVHFLGNVSNEMVDPMKSINLAGAKDEYLKNSIRSMTYQNTAFNKSKLIRYDIKYYANYEQEQYINQQTDLILKIIIKPGMNIHEKERAIHDYLVLNIAYDDSQQYGSAYDALTNNKAVCHGYTLLAYKLLEKTGIKSLIIDSPEMKHTWNLVFIDGAWYHLDVTWDDPIPDVAGRVLYNYYNLSDNEIMYRRSKKHYWERENYPKAVTEYNYRFNSSVSPKN